MHALFFVAVFSICIYQVLAVSKIALPDGSRSDISLQSITWLCHGALAIVASYLEATFIAIASAVLDPVSYTNRELPDVALVKVATVAFICHRLVFGLGVGIAGFLLARYRTSSPSTP